MKLPKLKTETVEVAGSTIAIRELSLSERATVNDAMQADGAAAGMVATLQAGVPEMHDWSPAQFEEIRPAALEELAAAVFELSGLGPDSAEDAEKK